MSNLNVTLSATLSVTDTTLATPAQFITRLANNPLYAATSVFFDPFFQAVTIPTLVPLPAATVYVVWIRNLDSTNVLTVNWTTVGGGSQVFSLVPGAVFTYFMPKNTAGGVTSITLTGNALTNAEVLLAA